MNVFIDLLKKSSACSTLTHYYIFSGDTFGAMFSEIHDWDALPQSLIVSPSIMKEIHNWPHEQEICISNNKNILLNKAKVTYELSTSRCDLEEGFFGIIDILNKIIPIFVDVDNILEEGEGFLLPEIETMYAEVLEKDNGLFHSEMIMAIYKPNLIARCVAI